jgi:hypothetical protein
MDRWSGAANPAVGRSFILWFILVGMRMTMQNRIVLSTTFLLAVLSIPAVQAQNASPDPNAVPVIDGAIGPCSADFTITDASGAPVYDAKIKVHIAYRFGSFHKLDLEVGPNAAGKARFIGLPEKTKQGLFFRASQGDREGSAFDDLAKTCKTAFTVALEKKNQ